ncbi:MAG: hypothetical protein R3D28_24490 [Geminicoccaceae bacterium]
MSSASASASSPARATLTLMVTGPVTKNMAEALRRTDAALDPKWVVAVGDCARDGGLFEASYAGRRVGAVVPVDLATRAARPRRPSCSQARSPCWSRSLPGEPAEPG